MKLYGTRFSHFTRKARILLDLYGVAYEFIDAGNITEVTPEKLSGNPIARVPVLEDGANWLIDSDHIADYLVEKLDPSDRFRVRSPSHHERNMRAVLNGIMLEEVTWIVAKRMGVPVESFEFFQDALSSVRDGLSWLETQAKSFQPEKPGYLEYHLVCVWEHLDFFKVVPLEFKALRSIVERIASDPIVQRMSPRNMGPKPPTAATQ